MQGKRGPGARGWGWYQHTHGLCALGSKVLNSRRFWVTQTFQQGQGQTASVKDDHSTCPTQAHEEALTPAPSWTQMGVSVEGTGSKSCAPRFRPLHGKSQCQPSEIRLLGPEGNQKVTEPCPALASIREGGDEQSSPCHLWALSEHQIDPLYTYHHLLPAGCHPHLLALPCGATGL